MSGMHAKGKLVSGGVEVRIVVPLDGGNGSDSADSETHTPPAGGGGGPASRPSHAPGFESVNWYGTVYHFTGKQALVVASLWQAWQDGHGALSQEQLLEDAESSCGRLRDLFDGGRHPAWGTMVVPALKKGGQRGRYMLDVPTASGGGE